MTNIDDTEMLKRVEETTGNAIPYGLLALRRHPEYREDFWRRARAFYKGGVHLLEDEGIMRRVFPRHVNEEETVYGMRRALAHYTNHAGALVNHILGKLMSDPARVATEEDKDLDKFYEDFLQDCSPPMGKRVSINTLVSSAMLNAAQCQRGYALVEMPQKLDVETMSLAQQEASGALHAWCVEIEPESVVDWKVDKNGEYEWVLLCFKGTSRNSVFEDRGIINEEYWMYNREGWVRWDVSYHQDDEPKPQQVISATAFGPHTFGKVPLVQLCLPDGLWVMSKLESLAREFFNKRNALSWAEFKALLPVLYEFLDPGVMPTLSGPGGDPDRATSQRRSPAHVLQRQAAPGSGDRAEWVSPPHAPFDHALKSCDSIRDDIHRVVQEMALSADTQGAMLRRSAQSKQKDSDSLDVVLVEYGRIAKEFILELLQLVEAGRGDQPNKWSITGMTSFDHTSSAALIEEETILDTVVLPSPTFKATRKKQLARKVLGDSIPESKLQEIDEEIDAAFSPEGELMEEADQQEAEQSRQENERGEDSEDDGAEETKGGGRPANVDNKEKGRGK